MLCGDLNGKEIRKRGGICIYMADSLCYTAKKKKKKKKPTLKQLYSN